ncbi:hypothetical protein, variant [Phytophthora nicotianae CJ01A1]|uniref:Uncharacterized protein n=2 Tax=Phytophthora nicotianae TaxID=4792 RepID=W2WHV6_PHYNI|nr:hypothetical protein, variant [Phytophthora nicotianae]ETP09688.1 hypothetical protein, variant [Phytophthora nicotianae CJ01A1]
MASQLQAQGDDVLQTIRQMKKTSKNQKQTTKTNNLKNYSKELESLLLRMYNEASTARESKKMGTQHTTSTKNVTTPRSDGDNQQNDDDDSDSNPAPLSISLASTSTFYAAELEELIRTEQLNRVALIKQISSEREQRAALKQFLSAFSQEHNDDIRNPAKDNQSLLEDMQDNVRQLIYDAVIGRQMIEATLEEEVQSCEKDFDACYQKLLHTLRDNTNSAVNVEKQQDQEQRIAAMLEASGGNNCSDEMLKLEISNELRKVFSHLQEDLAEYEEGFINAASASDAAGSIEAASSKGGGWSEANEERFLKVLRSYENKHGAGKKPQLLYDQLALVLPNVPLIEIKKHVKFHQHYRFYQEKRKDRQREFQRKLEELQNGATTRFRTAMEQEQERVRKLQQLHDMQQQCDQRHEQISQWRVTKEAKERIEKQQREIEQLLENQKQIEEELQWRRKHDQQKIAVDEYKKGKTLQKMADEKLTMEEEQRRGEERALQSVVNAERVQYRHHEFQRKMEEMKQEELHKAELEGQRLVKLNELKETTPYAQIIANIAVR